jgi:hypothetical protein
MPDSEVKLLTIVNQKNTKNNLYTLLLAFLISVNVMIGSMLIYKQLAPAGSTNHTENYNSKPHITPVDSTKITQPAPQPPAPSLISISNHSLYMGNVFFGRYVDDWSVQAASPNLQNIPKYQANASDTRDYKYPFSKLDTFDRTKYDTWVAGLECPVTDSFVGSATQDETLNFTCLPGYITEAKKYFDVFTLANNHIDNMQQIDGFGNTRKVLDSHGIQYFGHFDNSIKTDICEVVSLKSKSAYSDGSIKNSSIPVAMCGYHNVFKLPLQDEVEVISQYSKYFPTVVMPHQGAEYQTKSDPIKQETYHSFIDAGADLVVGDHPHATQETEYYKGKLIVYSLGNFIFDQQYSSLVTNAITLDSKILFEGEGLQNYLDLDYNCNKFQDNCLNIAQSKGFIKPKFSFKFDIIASDNSNKITKKASPEIQKQMNDITGFNNLNTQ